MKKELKLKCVDYTECTAHHGFREHGRDIDFCSPQCRDSHLLKNYKSRLTADIYKRESDLSELNSGLLLLLLCTIEHAQKKAVSLFPRGSKEFMVFTESLL